MTVSVSAFAASVGRRYAACFTTRMAYLSAGTDRTRVPRIEAHYLMAAWPAARLLQPGARAYLAARGLVRQLRGIR